MARTKLTDEQVVTRFFATADHDVLERALANGKVLMDARFPAWPAKTRKERTDKGKPKSGTLPLEAANG